jgi:hypothetical protein
MTIEFDEDLDEDVDDDEDREDDLPPEYAERLMLARARQMARRMERLAQLSPPNKHVKPDTLPRHAKCSICEVAAQAHPHKLCELTPQVVAQTVAEADSIRKRHDRKRRR